MKYIDFLALLLLAVGAEAKYKLCVTEKIDESTCNLLLKGDSQVSCLRVSDSAECAIRLRTGEADFGIFNAEELLLAYHFYPDDIIPIFKLVHKDRLLEKDFQFQAVAVVPSTVNSTGHATNFETLRNGGLCHPGFSSAQRWNDYILKYFERKVAATECQSDLTIVENEVQNIKKFFGKACRPGEWATDPSFDKVLKKKHPELCALCDDQASCSYKNLNKHGHIGALECLKSGRGKVAYVALAHVREFFKEANDSFQFLCTDGMTQPLTTETPCAWIQQRWPVIAARKSIAINLTKSLKEWLTSTYAAQPWNIVLSTILQEDSNALDLTENTSIATYLSKGREIGLPNSQSCNRNPLRWCTISDLETEKCKWVAKEVQALGIEPHIDCKRSNSTFECFREIATYKSDLMTIDSNYGNLARRVYGLTTVLYSETASDKNSVVVAVTREKSDNPIKNFEDLKGRIACFPEYGGIAWLSFIHVARTKEILSSKSCDYPKLVANFLAGACTPGIRDTDHSNRTDLERRSEIGDILCSSCPSGENTTCSADPKNPYFGDRGALECLEKGDGDVAFIEIRNLKDMNGKTEEYRILCKNGSLATSTGFTIDDTCPLSVTIDSEIVGRRNSSEIDNLDTILALLNIENWLGYNAIDQRPIRIYDKFDNTKDLMFKDSSVGLVSTKSELKSVESYKELFNHVETCSAAPLTTIANLSLNILVVLSAIFFTRL